MSVVRLEMIEPRAAQRSQNGVCSRDAAPKFTHVVADLCHLQEVRLILESSSCEELVPAPHKFTYPRAWANSHLTRQWPIIL